MIKDNRENDLPVDRYGLNKEEKNKRKEATRRKLHLHDQTVAGQCVLACSVTPKEHVLSV